ncbi:hypothetical protein LLB_3523 [Legionella longbeachae D-4968]|nr:hypothetical protein LLB_3523 [Legionella longbeachae D-4968]
MYFIQLIRDSLGNLVSLAICLLCSDTLNFVANAGSYAISP